MAPRKLVQPYVTTILQAVVLVLSQKWCTVKARITALGVLVRVSCLRTIPRLRNFVVLTRSLLVPCQTSVVRCTGCVMTPYRRYPTLVRLLVKIMCQEADYNSTIRRSSPSRNDHSDDMGTAASSFRSAGSGPGGSSSSMAPSDTQGASGADHGNWRSGVVARVTGGGEQWRLKRAAFRAFGALGAVNLSTLQLSLRRRAGASGERAANAEDSSQVAVGALTATAASTTAIFSGSNSERGVAGPGVGVSRWFIAMSSIPTVSLTMRLLLMILFRPIFSIRVMLCWSLICTRIRATIRLWRSWP